MTSPHLCCDLLCWMIPCAIFKGSCPVGFTVTRWHSCYVQSLGRLIWHFLYFNPMDEMYILNSLFEPRCMSTWVKNKLCSKLFVWGPFSLEFYKTLIAVLLRYRSIFSMLSKLGVSVIHRICHIFQQPWDRTRKRHVI